MHKRRRPAAGTHHSNWPGAGYAGVPPPNSRPFSTTVQILGTVYGPSIAYVQWGSSVHRLQPHPYTADAALGQADLKAQQMLENEGVTRGTQAAVLFVTTTTTQLGEGHA
jgi:hypothetical protein